MGVKLSLPVFLCLVALGLSGCGGTSGTGGTLTTPTITSITPNPVVHGQTITIAGTNLNGTLTTATFSGGSTSLTSTASSGTSTSVVVVVPSNISYPATYSVTVATADNNGNSSGASSAVTLQVN